MKTVKKAVARHNNIRDLLLSKGTVMLSELCDTFNCSESTIRNDLAALEKQGVLKRVPGGAVANENTSRNSNITARMNMQFQEKNEIAEYVVKNLIRPNMIITLDSGTTTMLIAQKLLDYKIPCTVVTNSFIVATIAAKSSDIQLCLAGGCYDPEHASFHDDVSELIFQTLRSELCFISPNGIDADGAVTNSGVGENAVKQQMVRQALHTVILADHSKIGNTELKIICRAKDVQTVVTDKAVTDNQLKMLADAGFRVVIA